MCTQLKYKLYRLELQTGYTTTKGIVTCNYRIAKTNSVFTLLSCKHHQHIYGHKPHYYSLSKQLIYYQITSPITSPITASLIKYMTITI